jgi:glycosyltransferase involved in cell wall biosynthesis
MENSHKVSILYIIDGIQSFGGAEQNLLTIISAMDRAKYDIKCCLLKPATALEGELKNLNVPVFILNTPGKWDIPALIKLTRFMRREKINIVHSCLYISNTFGRIAAILAHVPVIISWEQGEILRQQPSRHHRIDRILARFSDCIVACSKACKEEMIKKENIPASKIRVIYNCVDLARFDVSTTTSTIREELGVTPDTILIGSIGHLRDEKKHQSYLIKAMPQIIKVYPKAKLLLVGEGPSKSDFIHMTKTLGVEDRVIFTGFRRDIPQIMSALDLHVSPSDNEALGILTIEAMSLKKAVVAIDAVTWCRQKLRIALLALSLIY